MPQDLLTKFQMVVDRLNLEEIRFALAGGLVASLYRTTLRATKDMDFLFLAKSESQTRAQEILTDIGLEPHTARKADLEGGPKFAIKSQRTPVCIVVGKDKQPENIGVDFMLEAMPWFTPALERAEKNVKNVAEREIPCLTAEDLIIAKFYSLSNSSTRFKDLDDLKEIFENQKSLDLEYISSRMLDLKLRVPEAFEKLAPPILNKVSKRIRSLIRKSLTRF